MTSYGVDRYKEDSEVEESIHEIVCQCLHNVDRAIDKKFLASIEVPIAADIAMVKLMNILSIATMKHDGVVTPGEPLEKIVPEREPVPCLIDNWARGTIPVRQYVPPEELAFRGEMTSDGTRTPSVSSYRSSATGRSKQSAHSRNVASRGIGKTDLHDSQIIELDDESSLQGSQAAMSATGHMFDMLMKANAKVRKRALNEADVKDEFQLIEEEIGKAAAELKGKKYIFDQDGKPLTINTVRPESLPPFVYAPELVISSEVNDKKQRQTTIKKKKKIRVTGARSIEEPYFTPISSLATTFGSKAASQFELNPGVSQKVGESVRDGPPPPDDPRKPSRKDFFNKKLLLSTTSSFNASQESIGDASAAAGSATSEGSLQETSPPPLSTGQLSLATIGTRYKDVDATEGGRKVKRVTMQDDKEESSSARQELGYAPKGKQAPANLPLKPSLKQKEIMDSLHGGSTSPGPRDRLAPGAKQSVQNKISQKQALLSKTTGHLSNESFTSNKKGSALENDSTISVGKSGGVVKRERMDISRELF